MTPSLWARPRTPTAKETQPAEVLLPSARLQWGPGRLEGVGTYLVLICKGGGDWGFYWGEASYPPQTQLVCCVLLCCVVFFQQVGERTAACPLPRLLQPRVLTPRGGLWTARVCSGSRYLLVPLHLRVWTNTALTPTVPIEASAFPDCVGSADNSRRSPPTLL